MPTRPTRALAPSNLSLSLSLSRIGIFGETGAAATSGNEVGSPVTFTTEVTERDRSFLVRVRASDGSLLSDIVSTRITVPGLSATRRCPCALSPSGICATLTLTDTASFSNSAGSTVLTRRGSGARVGGVFRANPVVFDTSSATGFEFCGKYVSPLLPIDSPLARVTPRPHFHVVLMVY